MNELQEDLIKAELILSNALKAFNMTATIIPSDKLTYAIEDLESSLTSLSRVVKFVEG